jgi:uncharacterized protein (TIGR04222 family)
MNPFAIHGPIYLVVYFAICGTAFLAAQMFKTYLLRDTDDLSESQLRALAHNLKPYEAAYLAGGPDRVFLTACAVLARNNMVEINGTTGKIKLVDSNAANRSDLDDIETALLSGVTTAGTTVATSQVYVKRACGGIKQSLESNKLIPPTGTAPGFWAAFLYIAVCLTFSVPKFVIATHLHLPFTFLTIASLVAVAFSFKLYRRGTEITARGSEILKIAAAENSALKLTHYTNPASLSMADAALAYGVFGALSLGDPFLDAQMATRRSSGGGSCGSSSGCGSSCGSSCGGGCGGGCGG